MPASVVKVWPVVYPDSSLASHNAAFATSSARPGRPRSGEALDAFLGELRPALLHQVAEEDALQGMHRMADFMRSSEVAQAGAVR